MAKNEFCKALPVKVLVLLVVVQNYLITGDWVNSLCEDFIPFIEERLALRVLIDDFLSILWDLLSSFMVAAIPQE